MKRRKVLPQETEENMKQAVVLHIKNVGLIYIVYDSRNNLFDGCRELLYLMIK